MSYVQNGHEINAVKTCLHVTIQVSNFVRTRELIDEGNATHQAKNDQEHNKDNMCYRNAQHHNDALFSLNTLTSHRKDQDKARILLSHEREANH